MRIEFGGKLVILSVAAVVVLVAVLLRLPDRPKGTLAGEDLMFYCAAGVKMPVDAVAREYEKEYGVKIQLQFGGSGTLLSNLEVSRRGDLYLAADDSYMDKAREKGLLAEVIPLARMRPVIAVRKGNPKKIGAIRDLTGDGVATALANPDAAAIGRIIRTVLTRTGDWDRLRDRARVFKPTVTDIANDIKIGAVDAGIVWDATASQYPELEAIEVPEFQSEEQWISVGVLKSAANPAHALKFARYLAARDKGLREMRRFGYRPVDGDVWAETPELILFSGAVNRLAIEESLKRFEAREGVRGTRVYNGCGILVSQMKAGQRPDAYFACDSPFMAAVSNLFAEVEEVSATDMVMLVQKGNPKGIRSLEDLAQTALKLGIANEDQSALGARTKQLLESAGLLDRIRDNVKTRTPTADLLVNQMRTGALDAAIVYRANTAHVRDKLDVIPIARADALAVQPIGVNRQSDHKYLVRRLKQTLMSGESRAQFESSGFTWRAGRHD